MPFFCLLSAMFRCVLTISLFCAASSAVVDIHLNDGRSFSMLSTVGSRESGAIYDFLHIREELFSFDLDVDSDTLSVWFFDSFCCFPRLFFSFHFLCFQILYEYMNSEDRPTSSICRENLLQVLSGVIELRLNDPKEIVTKITGLLNFNVMTLGEVEKGFLRLMEAKLFKYDQLQ